MNITVAGAGAIGGLIASRLARSGLAIKVLTTPRRLDATRSEGVRLVEEGVLHSSPVEVSTDARDFGPQDIVVLGLKATGLPAAAAGLAPLIGPKTLIVSTSNGIPWWYLAHFGGPVQGRQLQSVDPEGALARLLPPGQCIGCVVHLSSSVRPDGAVVLAKGNRLILGDPARGGDLSRVEPVAALLRDARFQVEVTGNVHREVWLKLWGNLTMNPISALTEATSDRILNDPGTLRLTLGMMEEARVLGERIGVTMDMTADERLAVARTLGSFKTSMLQDWEARRPLEIDAIIGSVAEIAERAEVPTPLMQAVLALLRQKASCAGLNP
jgi:2-dehydropantoate 2-reductase